MESHGAEVHTAAVAGLLEPTYWLVFGTEWQGDGLLAEAAAAVAPEVIARDAIAGDTYQVLGCADLFARKLGVRVVFFSELTRMFSAAGRSWADLGVDWQSALRELSAGQFLAIYLSVSRKSYDLVCDPSAWPEAAGSSTELEHLRLTTTDVIAARWSAYVKGLAAAADLGGLGECPPQLIHRLG
jgi:hypothetical protein